MAKPIPKFGPYNVIADTNALYARDSRKLVSVGFETALIELRKVATVQLYIPHVVIGELAYQKFMAASAAIADANTKLNVLSEITGAPRPDVCSPDQAKKRVLKRYETWCKTVSARRLVPKVRQAAWSKLVEDAIWRIPPFEHSEDSKHEKGFRDRVVLETVIQLCSNGTAETILLSGDGLLSKAVGGCGIKNLTVVPRLEDFTSRVRLLKETAEKEWVDGLFAEAERIFYSEDNLESLYWREKINEQINGRVSDLTPSLNLGGLTAIFDPKTWERQSEEIITLGTTQFEKTDRGRYVWKTDLISAAAFSGKGMLDDIQEKIRTSTFAIHWSSQVTETAEIKDVKFEGIDLTDKQLIPDTTESRSQWSLPAKPTYPWRSLADALKNITPALPK